ncbi:hypothetical protein SAMN05519104_1811 [Rhizobiales bacterium GAS188]|nr:hypothetical protein SAMN05519104_1811 [Rhizobiales bacterium GAS188]
MPENPISSNEGSQPDLDQELEAAVSLYEAGDEAGARLSFEKLAELGSAPAMTWLGYILYFGRGVAADKAEAHRWYSKAAVAGHAEAQHGLAALLDEAGDREEAERWVRKAADQGYQPSVSWVSEADAYKMLKDKRFDEALPVLRSAAEAGSAWAHEVLGWMCWTASGVRRDYGQAIEHYRTAYDGGRDIVARDIGRLHLNSGHPEIALEWLRKGIRKPISSLYWQYAVIKRHPHLARHPDELDVLLKQAAAAGHAFARRDLALRMMKGHRQFGTRLQGLCAWFGLFPYILRLVRNDENDERLK